MKVISVFYNGELVAEDGKLLKEVEEKEFDMEKDNSVHVKNLSVEDFKFVYMGVYLKIFLV